MRQGVIFMAAIASFGFQFGCGQPQTATTNATPVNAAVVNANQPVADANAANLTAEIVEAKSYSKTIKLQAEAVGQSIKNGDFERLAEYIHPKVFEMAGGRERLNKQGKEAFEEAKSEGYEITNYSVGEPKSAVVVEKELFVVVPVNFVTKEPKAASRTETTLIAISNDNGASWKFLSDMNQSRFKALFPAAATKLVIPEDKILPVAKK